MSVQLACTALGGTVSANAPPAPAAEVIGISANQGNLLMYSDLTPATTFTVIVNQPARIQSLSVAPTSVIGGASLIGTVTLTRAAPSGGFPIQLASSIPAAQLLTPSFIIRAGDTQQTFSIATLAVPSAVSVTISASSGDQSISAAFTINSSPRAISISLTRGTVVGGGSVQGTVSLTPAPITSALVFLTSSNSAVQVASPVQISAGTTSASITVSTSAVTSVQTATITATFQGTVAAATLEIDPANLSGLGGISLVTVHVPNPILLDKSRRKVYFMVDECESNSPREATRSSSE